MKDIHSSLGGSTLPGGGDSAGIVKGVVIRNKGVHGRRIGILTSEAEIKAGPEAHGADYAHEPVPVLNLPEGYAAGIEVELSAPRQYHKVLTTEVFYPAELIGTLGVLGRPDWVGYGEMSNKVAQWDTAVEKLGQAIHTSELRMLEGALGNYLFSLSIQNRGKIYHLGFDGLKHPARLTADLNYQLRKFAPGAAGYFEIEEAPPGESSDVSGMPRYNLSLYLSPKAGEGDLELYVYQIPNYETLAGVGYLSIPSQSVHLNSVMTQHAIVKVDEVVYLPTDGDFVTSYYDEVIPDLDQLLAGAQTMTSGLGEFQEYPDHFIWKPRLTAADFKLYPADPRFRIALLKLNYPDELGGIVGLKLAEVSYDLLSGPRAADLLPVRNDERVSSIIAETPNGIPDPDFNLPYGFYVPEHEWEFGALGGANAELVKYYDRDLTSYYVAVIAPPEDLNDTALFRKASPVELTIKLPKVIHEPHVISPPGVVQKTWDQIYESLDDPIPFPLLEGVFNEDLDPLNFRSGDSDFYLRGNPSFVGDKLNTGLNLTYQSLIEWQGYLTNFTVSGVLLSELHERTLALGALNYVNYQTTIAYPNTNLSLYGFGEIIYVKGNPSNNLTTPLSIAGMINGGFENGPLKHASTVEWEFYVVDGELIIPTDNTGLPVVGSLFNSVNAGFDKNIFENLPDVVEGSDGYFLNVKLTARFPWTPEVITATIAIPINLSVYVPEPENGEVPTAGMTMRLPNDVVGVQIYDPDTNEVILAIEDVGGLNTGEYWEAMEAASLYVQYYGRGDANPPSEE